jgi:hypothetical protein
MKANSCRLNSKSSENNEVNEKRLFWIIIELGLFLTMFREVNSKFEGQTIIHSEVQKAQKHPEHLQKRLQKCNKEGGNLQIGFSKQLIG